MSTSTIVLPFTQEENGIPVSSSSTIYFVKGLAYEHWKTEDLLRELRRALPAQLQGLPMSAPAWERELMLKSGLITLAVRRAARTPEALAAFRALSSLVNNGETE